MRRWDHLTAQLDKQQVQGVRRGGHLPAQPEEEEVQSRQGRLDAAGSREALDVTQQSAIHTRSHAYKCANSEADLMHVQGKQPQSIRALKIAQIGYSFCSMPIGTPRRENGKTPMAAWR